MNAEVAVYKGDDLFCMGTIRECAKQLHVTPEYVYYMLMPAYQRRLAKRKKDNPRTKRVVRV